MIDFGHIVDNDMRCFVFIKEMHLYLDINIVDSLNFILFFHNVILNFNPTGIYFLANYKNSKIFIFQNH